MALSRSTNLERLRTSTPPPNVYSDTPLPNWLASNVEALMPTPYFEQHRDYLQNYLRTGEKKIIGIGREVVGLRKDGTTFPMDLAVSELSIAGKRMFTGLIHDLTERKEAEKERERLLARERAARAEAEAPAKPRMIFWQRSVTSFAHLSLPRC